RVTAPDGDVEEAVLELRFRRDHHAAAEIAAVGDGQAGDAQLFSRSAVEGGAHSEVLPADERAQRGEHERRLAAEELARAVGDLDHFRAHAHVGDVDEVAGGRPALFVQVVDAAD